MKDAELIATKYHPAAAATNYTDSFDLGTITGKKVNGLVKLNVSIPAMALHVDTTKSITYTLQDSADDSSFANVAPLQQYSVAGVTSTGSVAATIEFALPTHTRRYVRLAIAVPSGDGDVTGDLLTVEAEVL